MHITQSAEYGTLQRDLQLGKFKPKCMTAWGLGVPWGGWGPYFDPKITFVAVFVSSRNRSVVSFVHKIFVPAAEIFVPEI